MSFAFLERLMSRWSPSIFDEPTADTCRELARSFERAGGGDARDRRRRRRTAARYLESMR